jgi:hypothetical protein
MIFKSKPPSSEAEKDKMKKEIEYWAEWREAFAVLPREVHCTDGLITIMWEPYYERSGICNYIVENNLVDTFIEKCIDVGVGLDPQITGSWEEISEELYEEKYKNV